MGTTQRRRPCTGLFTFKDWLLSADRVQTPSRTQPGDARGSHQRDEVSLGAWLSRGFGVFPRATGLEGKGTHLCPREAGSREHLASRVGM